jgi:replicative DNA helicase
MPNGLPPNDKLAEDAVLAELLARPDEIFDRVAITIEPAYFYDAANRHLAEAIWDLQQAGKKIDITAIATELQNKNMLQAIGGSGYLLTLLNTVPAATRYVEQHALTIRDKWRMRQVIALCQSKAVEGLGGGLEFSEQQWLEQIEAALSSIVHDVRTQGAVTVHEILEEVMHDLQGGPRDEELVRTGLLDLDRLISGLYAGDLIILAGRPGLGKSALAQNIVLNAAHPEGLGVLVVSPEMTGDQVALRMLCAQTGIDFTKLRKRTFSGDDWSKLTDGAQHVGKKPIWIHDASTVSVLEIRAYARQVNRSIDTGTSKAKAKKLGLVVVDYLQLVKGQREKGWSREQEVASISRDLKAMAKELKVPVLALSALNRSVEHRGKEKQPEMSDLRESGAIESDADTIMMMHRPDYYDDAARPGECDILVKKQRNGPTGKVTLQFSRGVMKFSNFIQGEKDYSQGDTTWYQDR